MRRFGATEQEIEGAEAQMQAAIDAVEVYGVWKENTETVEHFQMLHTQWNRVGLNGCRTGLNYPAVESYLRIFVKKKRWADVFRDLLIMESATLAYDAEVAQLEG